MSGFSNYDAWKTACCELWPNCSHCPYDEDEDFEETDDYNEDEEDYIRCLDDSHTKY